MYCEKCNIAFGATHCPICGSKNIRPPRSDDLCFLTEKEMIWAEMLEDILKQNNIPCLTKKALGIGMALKVGPMLERVKFYVPYFYLPEAEIIVESLFSGSKDSELNEN